MPDPALESLYSQPDSTGLQVGDPKLERLYAAVSAIPPPSPHPGVQAAEKVVGMAGDVVGNVMRFFGRRTSAGTAAALEPLATAGDTPALQYAGSIARGVFRGESPYPGVPAEQASAEFFRRHVFSHPEAQAIQANLEAAAPLLGVAGGPSRFLASPEGMAMAAESGIGLPLLNRAMAPVGAAAKAAVNTEALGVGLRQAPVAKQLGEFVSTGASLPGAYRQDVQRLLRTSEGEADLAAYVRGKELQGLEKLPVDVQDRIQAAIEKGTVPTLTPEEQVWAQALAAQPPKMVAERTAVGGRPNILGAQVQKAQQKAEAALARVDKARAGGSVRKLVRAEDTARRRMKSFENLSTQDIATTSISDTQAARDAMAEAMGKRVAYTPRQATTEFLRAEGAPKPYGGRVFSGDLPQLLSTGRMARRVSNPELTAQEINAASTAAGKPRVFRPIVESTLASGQANDVRVMNLKIVGQLAKKYGTPTTDERLAIGRHFSVKAGFTEAEKRALGRTKLPAPLDELVGNLNKRLEPADWSGMNNIWRWANSEFKRWALFSPGFVSRNVQNNVLQTMVYGNLNPATWDRAVLVNDAMRTGQGLDQLIKVGGKQMKVGDYIEDAIRRGVIGRGQVAQEVGTALEQAPHKGLASKFYAPHRALRSVNQFGEDVSRTSFDLFNQGKGYSPLASAERVDQILFNYSNRLTNPARAYLRRNAVPFINWHAQIGPLLVRTSLERPGHLGVMGAAAQRQNEKYFPGGDVSTLGPDVVEEGGIVTGKGKELGSLRAIEPQAQGLLSMNQYLPDLLNAGKDQRAAANAIAQLLYPQFGVPISLGAGRDVLTNREFSNKPATAPQGLKALWLIKGGPEFAAKHGIFLDKDGTVKAPDKLAYLLRSIPPARLPSVLADIVAVGQQMAGGQEAPAGSETRAQSFLTGVRTVERKPEVGQSIQSREKREQRKEKAKVLRRYPENVRKVYQP